MSPALAKGLFGVASLMLLAGGFVFSGNAADSLSATTFMFTLVFAFYIALRGLLPRLANKEHVTDFAWLYFGAYAYCALLFAGFTIFMLASR